MQIGFKPYRIYVIDIRMDYKLNHTKQSIYKSMYIFISLTTHFLYFNTLNTQCLSNKHFNM